MATSVPPIDASCDEDAPFVKTQRLPLTFTGRTGDFFGIWFVNITLTILTLGIYSAWAKVRTKRFFYGNTHVGGRAFDYHANPVAILIGRLIVVGFFVAANILSAVVPFFGFLFYPALILAFP